MAPQPCWTHKVALSNAKLYPAELVALASEVDLALLKIDAGRPLHAVRMAPAGDLMVGETVVTIGHPHGLRFSCTTGVLSATGRSTNLVDRNGRRLQNLIQCDAGINPGSSGGPWLNILGEVIGITASMKKNAENIAFAVPAATIRRQVPRMLDVERRYGFTTGLTVAATGPPRVTAVDAGSAAAKAGIEVGDLVTKLGDEPIPSVMEYHLALVGRAPGEALPIELTRQGEQIEASIELGERPAPPIQRGLLLQKLGLTGRSLERRDRQADAAQVGPGRADHRRRCQTLRERGTPTGRRRRAGPDRQDPASRFPSPWACCWRTSSRGRRCRSCCCAAGATTPRESTSR